MAAAAADSATSSSSSSAISSPFEVREITQCTRCLGNSCPVLPSRLSPSDLQRVFASAVPSPPTCPVPVARFVEIDVVLTILVQCGLNTQCLWDKISGSSSTLPCTIRFQSILQLQTKLFHPWDPTSQVIWDSELGNPSRLGYTLTRSQLGCESRDPLPLSSDDLAVLQAHALVRDPPSCAYHWVNFWREVRGIGLIPTPDDYRFGLWNVPCLTAKGYFKDCVQDPISGCWRYKLNDTDAVAAADQYTHVMRMKEAYGLGLPAGQQSAFLFGHPNLPALIDPDEPGPDELRVVRHHPFRCELFHVADRHGRCIRPSHLCYGTKLYNTVDMNAQQEMNRWYRPHVLKALAQDQRLFDQFATNFCIDHGKPKYLYCEPAPSTEDSKAIAAIIMSPPRAAIPTQTRSEFRLWLIEHGHLFGCKVIPQAFDAREYAKARAAPDAESKLTTGLNELLLLPSGEQAMDELGAHVAGMSLSASTSSPSALAPAQAASSSRPASPKQ